MFEVDVKNVMEGREEGDQLRFGVLIPYMIFLNAYIPHIPYTLPALLLISANYFPLYGPKFKIYCTYCPGSLVT